MTFSESKYRKLQNCRICEGEFAENSLNLKPTPPANGLYENYQNAKKAERYPLEVKMCKRCLHFQLGDIVDPKFLFDHYVYRTGTSQTFDKHFRDFARFIKKRFPNFHSILEVGSNDGLLLGHLKQQGFEAVGIEPSDKLVAESVSKSLTVYQGYFESDLVSSRIGKKKFDLIIGNNVFAHIDDLSAAIKLSGNLLSEKGALIFEVAHFLKIVTDGTFDAIYHEHMSYHTVISMQKFLEMETDLEIFDVELISTHGGSLRFYRGKKGSHEVQGEKIGEVVNIELNNSLNDSRVLTQIEKRINQLKNEVKNFLTTIHDSNTFIFGYGAPAKAVTFIAEMELENIDIEFIIDDNPDKQDRYLPGSGFKVVSAQFAKEYSAKSKNGNFCIFFPWNIGEELLLKVSNLNFLNLGLISFFPDFKVRSIS